MKRLSIFLCILLIHSLSYAQEFTSKYSSGDEELDQVRSEIQVVPTDRSNYASRAILMKLWAVSLQQQGVHIFPNYASIDTRLRAISKWNPMFHGGDAQAYTDKDIAGIGEVLKEGYQVLENYQHALVDDPKSVLFAVGNQHEDPVKPSTYSNIDWAQYRGNLGRTGYTGAQGPTKGATKWRFPVGLAWEAAPVVKNGVVYLTSPGIRNFLWQVDLKTGQPIKVFKQTPSLKGDQLYSSPAMASTPILDGDHVILREMGSRGNRGESKNIAFLNLKSGKIEKKIDAGHVDYRAGYAPVQANDKVVVFPFGIHDIEDKPPVCQPFNRIVVKDKKTGKKKWDFNIGPTFSSPVLDDSLIFATNQFGNLYALKTYQWFAPASSHRIAWEFQAGSGINKAVAVNDQKVVFGANDGFVYCLDKRNGQLIWKKSFGQNHQQAFRYFSTPYLKDGKVFIGSADKQMMILDIENGEALFKAQANDWVRATPVADNRNAYFSSMDGHIYQVNLHKNKFKINWEKRFGEHFIYADLALADGHLLFNDSDLYTFCISEKGKKEWQFSSLKSFKDEEGFRIFMDQLAGGAYYQSKPTIAEGKLFIGTPSRFIYALDAESGEQQWKTEIGAAISGSPVYDNGKIYVGQQGGEDEFYCLDAKDGKILWTQKVGWVWGSCAVSDGLVFLPGVDGFVNCLDAESGHIVWRHRTERSTCSEPLVVGDEVFFGSWDHYLYKFDKATGKLKWKYQVNGGLDSGSPVAGEGKVFLPVGGGTFRAIDPKDHKILWTPKLEAKMFNVTPAYHDGVVYISTLNGQGLGGVPVGAEIFAVDAKNGQLLWTFEGGGGLNGAIIGSNDRVYFGSTVNPYFFCVDPKGNGDGTTNLLWRVRMENKTEESVPALYNGKAYVLNSGGFLHCIE